jgi:sortase A
MIRVERLVAAAVILALVVAAATLGGAAWINAKAHVAQWLIARAWSRAQAGERVRPWPWADTWPVARLTIAGDEQPLWVLEGASGRNLAFGPAHDPASVLPGERGNSVIEGHRDTHFARLRGVRVGDSLEIERPDGRLSTFHVVEVQVVDSRRWRISLETSGPPRLTLVTCYPFDTIRPGGPLRLVVTADAERA